MTEENPKITSVNKDRKEKDPKRVEAGKKLAAISKEAKERKMRERIEKEKEDNWNTDYSYLIGAGVLGILSTVIYYQVTKDPPKNGEAVITKDPKKSDEAFTKDPKTDNDLPLTKGHKNEDFIKNEEEPKFKFDTLD